MPAQRRSPGADQAREKPHADCTLGRSSLATEVWSLSLVSVYPGAICDWNHKFAAIARLCFEFFLQGYLTNDNYPHLLGCSSSQTNLNFGVEPWRPPGSPLHFRLKNLSGLTIRL